MKALTLKSVSDVGPNQYQVTYEDEHGDETIIVCEIDESDGIQGMNPITRTEIFARGYADPMATCQALYAFRDNKGI